MNEISVPTLSNRLVKIVRDFSWPIVGNVFQRGSTLIAILIIARTGSIGLVGEYGIVQTTLLTFSVLAGFGSPFAVSKFLPETQTADRSRVLEIVGSSFVICIVSSGLVALLLYALAPTISNNLFDSQYSVSIIRYCAPALVINSFASLLIGVLAGFGKFREIGKANVWSGVFFLVVMSICSQFGTVGLIIGINLTSFIGFLTILPAYYSLQLDTRLGVVHICVRKSIILELLRFCFPAVLSSLIIVPMTWIGLAFLSHNSNSQVEVSVFSAALQWRTLVAFIPLSIAPVFLNQLGKKRRLDSASSIKILERNILLGTIFIGVGVSTAVGLIAFRLPQLYGSEFDALAKCVQVMALAGLFISVSNAAAQIMASSGENHINLAISITSLIVFVLLAGKLTQEFGALGLSIAFATSSLAQVMGQLIWLTAIRGSVFRNHRLIAGVS